MWRLFLGTMGVKSLVQGLNAAATAGFEPRTVWSEVRRRNRLATAPPLIGPNSENSQFYFNFEWKTGICVQSATSESKSTLIMTANHGDISVDLQGSLTAQKRACMLLSINYLMVISCNTFGVTTSPNVADLSTSFNGMNLNMWSCPSSSFGMVIVGFQEH